MSNLLSILALGVFTIAFMLVCVKFLAPKLPSDRPDLLDDEQWRNQ